MFVSDVSITFASTLLHEQYVINISAGMEMSGNVWSFTVCTREMHSLSELQSSLAFDAVGLPIKSVL